MTWPSHRKLLAASCPGNPLMASNSCDTFNPFVNPRPVNHWSHHGLYFPTGQQHIRVDFVP